MVMSIKKRLDDLCSNPRLISIGSDLEFAESLKQAYGQKGSLSKGRKEWLEKLEVKYSEENFVDPFKTEIGTTIKTLHATKDSFDQFDRGFIESVYKQYARYGNLSEKQQSFVIGVFEKYGPAGQEKRQAWVKNYNENFKNTAKIVARYYLSNPPYWQTLSEKILGEDGFIPSERQFNKFTKNKYAMKVVESTLSEPKYKVDDVIEARQSVGKYSRNGHEFIRGQKGFVLEVNSAPVISAAKGSKRYLVLPVGSAEPIHVEERRIKKARNI
jgi:hypothetical protein